MKRTVLVCLAMLLSSLMSSGILSAQERIDGYDHQLSVWNFSEYSISPSFQLLTNPDLILDATAEAGEIIVKVYHVGMCQVVIKDILGKEYVNVPICDQTASFGMNPGVYHVRVYERTPDGNLGDILYRKNVKVE